MLTDAPVYHVKPIFDELATLGLAVDHHPHYVNRKISQHRVDVVLITYISRGIATHFLDEETYQDGPGCLTITHYNQAHDILTDRRGISVYNLFIDLTRYPLPQMPADLKGYLPQVIPLNPTFSHQQNRRIRLQFRDTEVIDALFLALHREFVGKRTGFKEMLHLLFRSLLIKCCRWAAQHGIAPLRDPSSANERKVEQIRRLLEEHPAEPHTLDGLAKQIGWGRGLLCRQFKNYTGKSLFSYLLELRIQQAMVQLRHNDDKILAVALDAGFNNIAHFNQSFRKYVGITPSAYRRRVHSTVE